MNANITPVRKESENAKFDITVTKAQAIISRLLNELDDAYDNQPTQQELVETVNNFIAQESHPGDADDFHNLSVTLARKHEYLLACKVLDCGLRHFPRNVDLLADKLLYALSCGTNEYVIESVQANYETLMAIPKRFWTWRGFSFAVSYTLQTTKNKSVSDEELDTVLKNLLSIVQSYKDMYFDSEDPYCTEIAIYKELNMRKEHIETLKAAVTKIKSAPRCNIMLADVYFEQGDYDSAATCLKTAMKLSNQKRSISRDGYLYFLSALCKLAKLNDLQDIKEADISEKVIAIYSDFNVALPLLTNNDSNGDVDCKDVMKNKLLELYAKYNVPVSDRYEDLYNFFNEIRSN